MVRVEDSFRRDRCPPLLVMDQEVRERATTHDLAKRHIVSFPEGMDWKHEIQQVLERLVKRPRRREIKESRFLSCS